MMNFMKDNWKSFQKDLSLIFKDSKQEKIEGLIEFTRNLEGYTNYIYKHTFITTLMDIADEDDEEVLQFFIKLLQKYIDNMKCSSLEIQYVIPILEKLSSINFQSIRNQAVKNICKIYHEFEFPTKEEIIVSIIKKFSIASNQFCNITAVQLICYLFYMMEDPKNKEEIIVTLFELSKSKNPLVKKYVVIYFRDLLKYNIKESFSALVDCLIQMCNEDQILIQYNIIITFSELVKKHSTRELNHKLRIRLNEFLKKNCWKLDLAIIKNISSVNQKVRNFVDK